MGSPSMNFIPVHHLQSSGDRHQVNLPGGAKLGFDSKCLKEVGPILGKWADGSADPTVLSASWACLEKAIELFKTKVVARNSKVDEYSPEEVASFFQGYVFKELKFNKSFLS